MTIQSTQIDFLLSGGINNNNPNKSLGGEISSHPIIGDLNNLFADVTSEESNLGKIDFRCFYIKNNSNSDYLYNANVYIYSQRARGSSVQIGIAQVTDIQRITITGQVSGGSVVFNYKGLNASVSWGNSASDFKSNLLTVLPTIGLADVDVSLLTTISSNAYSLSFGGKNNFRNIPLLEIKTNALIGITKPSVSVKKQSEGQPVNSLAPTLAVETVAPDKVQFFDSDPSNKINLGTLGPNDFVPIWIKRTTPASTEFVEKDYFTLKLSGSTV